MITEVTKTRTEYVCAILKKSFGFHTEKPKEIFYANDRKCISVEGVNSLSMAFRLETKLLDVLFENLSWLRLQDLQKGSKVRYFSTFYIHDDDGQILYNQQSLRSAVYYAVKHYFSRSLNHLSLQQNPEEMMFLTTKFLKASYYIFYKGELIKFINFPIRSAITNS